MPSGALAIDTSTMPNPGNYGFKLRDGGGGTISSVAVAGSAITVTLSQAPTAGATLEYAYENPAGISGTSAALNRVDGTTDIAGSPAKTAGSWGNIRDARADIAELGGPLALNNWLCIGKWTIA